MYNFMIKITDKTNKGLLFICKKLLAKELLIILEENERVINMLKEKRGLK